MSVFDRLNTLLRANVTESVTRITDANAVRIYRQGILDAETLANQRRDALAATIATRRELEKDIERLAHQVSQREAQVKSLPDQEASEELLTLAAREIAELEAEVEIAKRRHIDTCELISREERALRKLLGEIREHRREIGLLESQFRRQSVNPGTSQTLSGRLAALRETRARLNDSVLSGDALEAGMNEAMDRVHGSELEQALSRRGLDERSTRVAEVLARLRKGASPA